MEINYTQLKKKKVVNVLDGRDLGKVTDLILTYPEGKIIALIVGKKSFFQDDSLLINLCCVNKIGDDTVLVSLNSLGVHQSCCTDEVIE